MAKQKAVTFTDDLPRPPATVDQAAKEPTAEPSVSGIAYAEKHFGRFLSPTGKGRSARYGYPETIGLERDPATGAEWINSKIVVALTHVEAETYRREYNRMVREGALEERTSKDYATFAGLI